MTTDTIAGLSRPVPTELLIGGKWVAGSGGDRFDVTDPADGSTLCTVADATAADTTAAIDAAYSALPELAAMPPRQRAEILRTAFEVMTERGRRHCPAHGARERRGARRRQGRGDLRR